MHAMFSITQWYPGAHLNDAQVRVGWSIAVETSTILIKFDKKQHTEQVNFPFALTRHTSLTRVVEQRHHR